MSGKGIGLIAVAAALIPFTQMAAAQNYKGTPKPSIQDYGPFPTTTVTTAKAKATAPPSGQCGNPWAACLFYGGDFLYNPVYPPFLAGGLANENTLFVSGNPYGAAVWIPFIVPAGQKWDVTGLFTNNQASYGVLDQGTQPSAVAYWAINQQVSAGSAGVEIDSGTSPATSTATGRSAFGLNEFTVQVTGLSITLAPGAYWLTVVPICTNLANPYCDGVFFTSDVEYLNSTPVNAYGPAEPLSQSYFDSPYFAFSFEPTWGPAGVLFGNGGDAFSGGVLGKIAKK
jgi:hypothetical protein